MPPTTPEIAYNEAIRALESQDRDLTTLRGHASVTLTGAAIAAAFLAGKGPARGGLFWMAVAFFAVGVAAVLRVYWPIIWKVTFDAQILFEDHVDVGEPPEEFMRFLALQSERNYKDNKDRLDWRVIAHLVGLVALGGEVLMLLLNLAY